MTTYQYHVVGRDSRKIATLDKQNIYLLGASNLRRMATSVLRIPSVDIAKPNNSGHPTAGVQLAIDDQSSIQLKKRLEVMVRVGDRALEGKVAVLMIGTNDVLKGMSLRKMRHTFLHLMVSLKKTGISKVVLCTTVRNFRNPLHDAQVASFNEFLERFHFDIPVFFADMRHELADRSLYDGDGIHLNLHGLRALWGLVQGFI